MLMSHLIYATFSLLFHFKLDEGFDIQFHQIWILHQQTPMTKSKNSARLCNLSTPSPNNPPEAKGAELQGTSVWK